MQPTAQFRRQQAKKKKQSTKQPTTPKKNGQRQEKLEKQTTIRTAQFAQTAAEISSVF